MEKLDKYLTLHYDTEEIPQEGTIWYDCYTPLSATSTYRTSPPSVTQRQTETATLPEQPVFKYKTNVSNWLNFCIFITV